MSSTPTGHACGKCGREVQERANLGGRPVWVCPSPCAVLYEPGGQRAYYSTHSYKTTPMAASAPVLSTPQTDAGHRLVSHTSVPVYDCATCAEQYSVYEVTHHRAGARSLPACSGTRKNPLVHIIRRNTSTPGQSCIDCGKRFSDQEMKDAVTGGAPLTPCAGAPQAHPGAAMQAQINQLTNAVLGSTFSSPILFVEPEKVVASRPVCSQCPTELSSTMDAYYGRDEYLKGMCSPCRGVVEKKRKELGI